MPHPFFIGHEWAPVAGENCIAEAATANLAHEGGHPPSAHAVLSPPTSRSDDRQHETASLP